MVSATPQVLLFTIDAGGGHRAAARALQAAVEETRAPIHLRVESFQQTLLPLDVLKRLTGLSLEDAYNVILRQHWSAFMVPLLRVMHAAIRVRRSAIVRTLAGWLRAQPRPAAVVSVFPNFNGILEDAIAASHPGVPLVVVLTDLADFPPRFWIEPGIDRVVVATDEARRQALAIGIPEPRITCVSGMVLHPRFHRAGGKDAGPGLRAELGFAAGDFVVTLLFGGKGSPEMLPLAARLLDDDLRRGSSRSAATTRACTSGWPRWRGARADASRRSASRTAWPRSSRRPTCSSRSPGRDRCRRRSSTACPSWSRATCTRSRRSASTRTSCATAGSASSSATGARSRQPWPRLRADPARREAIRARLAALPENRAVYEVVDVIRREAGVTPSSHA